MDAAQLHDEPVEPDVVASDVVYRGAVWNVRSDTVRYGDGEIVRQYVEHPGAAAVVALDDEERIVLIQQYRHPLRLRDWEIPAGLLDVAGEPPLETARRELAEEVDLVAEHWQPLLSLRTSPGGNDEVVHVFLARGLSDAPEAFARADEEADMTLARVPLREAVDAVMAGRVSNGILVASVLAAAEVLRREAGDAAGR
ncbi:MULTISPECIES: NUDIX domain-containing protein [Microbacterium]|uniref:NUDIX hydrolase n=1 Tax=Microbacterium wangchenii TaxID=2541726 RepID=A0ABX5SSW7_9MICO|nr:MULTISPECIES: NUDIX hydrolase [Microbacterium]MCK6064871.1 NUDIX hydrolase [Microbacterium sp. EYE_512]QBR88360.1 NUDIX hydrolase [Microbacterium wangchenii]